jgi:hypothetical protein
MVHVNNPQMNMIHLKFAIKTRMAMGLNIGLVGFYNLKQQEEFQ